MPCCRLPLSLSRWLAFDQLCLAHRLPRPVLLRDHKGRFGSLTRWLARYSPIPRHRPRRPKLLHPAWQITTARISWPQILSKLGCLEARGHLTENDHVGWLTCLRYSGRSHQSHDAWQPLVVHISNPSCPPILSVIPFRYAACFSSLLSLSLPCRPSVPLPRPRPCYQVRLSQP